MRASFFQKSGRMSGSGLSKVPKKIAILNIKVQLWHMYGA